MRKAKAHGTAAHVLHTPLEPTVLFIHCPSILTEILKAYAKATGAPLLAVSGNVDDVGVKGASQLLPPHRVLDVSGWKLLLTHIVAPGPTHKGWSSVGHAGSPMFVSCADHKRILPVCKQSLHTCVCCCSGCACSCAHTAAPT